MMKSILRFMRIVLAAAFLSACGGGDGGDSSGSNNSSGGNSTPKTAINEENADQISALVLTSTSGLLNAGSSATGVLPVQPTPSAASAVISPRFQLAAITEGLVDPSFENLTYTLDCNDGGTMTLNMSDDFQLSVGDKTSVVYDNCTYTYQPYSFTLDGEMETTYLEVPDGFSSINYSVRMQYKNFRSIYDDGSGTVYDTSIDGSWIMAFAMNDNVFESRVSSDGITIVSNGITTTTVDMEYGFVFDMGTQTYTAEYNYSVTSSAFAGTFSVETLVPLQGSIYGNPEVGTLRVTALDGSSVEINADTGNPDTLILTINTGGSVTSRELTWAELYRGAFD